MTSRPRPVVLCILDGWGERPPEQGHPDDNAIERAKTPVWHEFMRRWPHAHLDASEHYVGLPDGQMGNSEVGHTNLGAGRVVMQDLPRIDKAIADGTLPGCRRCKEFIAKVKAKGGTAHVMGLMSPGGVHSHQHQIAALAKILADAGLPVAVHAFLDGRDTPPKSADRLSQAVPARHRRARCAAHRHRHRGAITRWTATSAGTGSRRPIAR